MVGTVAALAFIMSGGPLAGIYCNEVYEVLMEYQEITGAYTMEEIEQMMSRCDGWEEKYEEDVEAGEVEPINK